MLQLPKGYYAVQCDFENAPKDTFTYKGVTYAVKEGENLFASIHDANPKATEIPDTVIEGLDYESFTTPVVLFSKGFHNNTFDRFTFDHSLTVLGEGACINPNVPSEDPLAPPERNPLRAEENETLIKGSYWFGKVFITNSNSPETVIVDGISSRAISFRDYRDDGNGDAFVAFRNVIHVSPCGYVLYYFDQPKKDSLLHREIELKNIRVDNYDDYGYGTNFGSIVARKATLENIYYNCTEQNFGPTSMTKGAANCEQNSERSEMIISNCYFSNFKGINGVATSTRGQEDKIFDLTVKDSVFVDACRVNESPLNPHVPNDESKLTVTGCRFVDTRGKVDTAISVYGSMKNVTVSDCTFRGFKNDVGQVPPLPTVAPDYIENRAENWCSGTEDAHTVVGTDNADFTKLDALYEGTKAYYGDQHVHTACGGTSDGSFPMDKWVEAMDEKDVDFAIIVDHRQMRGFFLPEWNEERFVMGSEPGTSLKGLTDVHFGQNSIHYNMLVPHKYGLAMIMANFPEFEFRGDELTGSYKYPGFTKERFLELTAYIQSIGGMMVHPHPKTMLASDNVLDYYIGEHTHLETIYGARGTGATFKNYELWVALLAEGKHIYASSGSDTHGKVSNAALSTFYTKKRHSSDFFEEMRRGNYTAGEVGIKMCINGNVMGSEVKYEEGMKLTLRMDDFYKHALKENTVYELRIVTDKGVAYASRCNGKLPQAVELEVQRRDFYRAEIYDITHCEWVAHGNPIWLEYETEEQK